MLSPPAKVCCINSSGESSIPCFACISGSGELYTPPLTKRLPPANPLVSRTITEAPS